MEQELLVGGKGAMAMLKAKQLADEEGLSEGETKEQIENNQYYRYLREKRIKNHLEQMKLKEVEMEEELGGVIVDFNNDNLPFKKSNTISGTTTGNQTEATPSAKTSKSLAKKPINMFGRFGTRPIGQKKVTAEIGQTENKKKSDIGFVASGMQKFMR